MQTRTKIHTALSCVTLAIGIILMGSLCVYPCWGASVFGKIRFLDEIILGRWCSISNITLAAGSGGTYTNGTYTNYYRISGTNNQGRLPVSTNCSIVLTGTTNASNAVVMTWPRYDGVRRYVIERSYDAGATWTNWTTVEPGATTWTDYGTNTYAGTTSFTNAYPVAGGSTQITWHSGTEDSPDYTSISCSQTSTTCGVGQNDMPELRIRFNLWLLQRLLIGTNIMLSDSGIYLWGLPTNAASAFQNQLYTSNGVLRIKL